MRPIRCRSTGAGSQRFERRANHTTLVAAVKAAGLVETLKGKRPFTVFAPTNAAFGMLPAGNVANISTYDVMAVEWRDPRDRPRGDASLKLSSRT
jgi:uncharacterized surface protein with fasciclin (FAS1) repeats